MSVKSINTNRGVKSVGDKVSFPSYDEKFPEFIDGVISVILPNHGGGGMAFFVITPDNNMYCKGLNVTRSDEELNLVIIEDNAENV